jgi:starvation-inducible DNA-binding protein
MATQPARYETRIDLGLQARLLLAQLLNQRLADMIDLFNQTKHAHWNVKGAEFMPLHELFDDIAERVEESATCSLSG